MGTTTHGYPYPEPTDPVAAGADAIRALATALDTTVARGYVALAAKTAAQSGIVALTDIAGLTVTFTARAARRYLATATGLLYSSASGDIIQMQICDSLNNLFNLSQISSVSNQGLTVSCRHIFGGTGASITLKVRAQRSAGTGTVSFDSAGAYPGYLLVQDIGPV